MKTEYKKLFELRVNHSYYADGKSQDFDFVPSEDTLRLLKNLRLLLRIDTSGMSIYYPTLVGSSVALIDFVDKVFKFGLLLKNPYFSNITVLPSTSNYLKNHYIAPASGGGFEVDTENVLKAKVFTYNIQAATRPLTINLKKGATIYQNILMQDSLQDSCLIKMVFLENGEEKQLPDGTYKIEEEDNTHAVLKSTSVKLNNDFADMIAKDFRGKSILGIAEITASAVAVASPYTLTFEAQKSKWDYYLIMKSSTPDTDVFTIKDEGKAKIDFGAASSVSVATMKTRITIPEQSKVLKIQSVAAIPFSNNPQTNLKLLKNGDNPISLSNPSAMSLKTEQFIYL